MNLTTLIPLALKTAVVVTVFALGLSASPQDATYLFRRPALLLRSLLSMNVVMPLVAAAMAAIFRLHTALEIALVILAVSPVPPMLPRKAGKAGGDASYAIGLLVAEALLAIVCVPLSVDLLGRVFGRDVQMSPGGVALVVALTVLGPLAAGLAVNRVAPAFAARVVKPVSLAALVLLVISAVPTLFTAMPTIVSLIGNGTLVAIVAFVLAGLAAGHLLGGPEPNDRPVLALMTASRHPGVAVAIAAANFPGQKLVVAAIVVYLLVVVIVSIPYVAWCKRRHTATALAV